MPDKNKLIVDVELNGAEAAIEELKEIKKEVDEIENKEKSKCKEHGVEKCYDCIEAGVYVPWGVTTFEQMEAIEDAEEIYSEIKKATKMISPLVENVIYDTDIEDKESALRRVMNGFISKFKEAFSGNKKESKSNFAIFKDKNGEPVWVAIYSNNALDDDYPQEILSESSHKKFINMVDTGEVPYPDLRLWHTKEWIIGQATWVGYDDNGFAMSAGYFHDYALPVVKELAEAKDVALSHGMRPGLVYNKKDTHIIEEYVSFEISVLPLWAAANKATTFSLVKEEKMLDKNKRESLMKDFGISADTLDAIEAANANKSQEFDANGVPRKEATPEDKVEQVEGDVEKDVTDDEPEVEVDETVAKDETPVEDVPAEETPEPVFTEEQVKELGKAFVAFEDKLIESVKEAISDGVKEARTERVKEVEEVLKETPAFSLQELLFPVSPAKPASESDETLVDGRSKFAKQKPKETPTEEGIDGLIGNILGFNKEYIGE